MSTVITLTPAQVASVLAQNPPDPIEPPPPEPPVDPPIILPPPDPGLDPNPDTRGSVSWESMFFGHPFGPTTPTTHIRLQIPVGGKSIRFTVPMAVRVGGIFGTVEIYAGDEAIDFAINQVVKDATSPVHKVLGSYNKSIIYGINLPGFDIDLVPGYTYFWNLKGINNNATQCWIKYGWQQR
jgi:hypothetical protein